MNADRLAHNALQAATDTRPVVIGSGVLASVADVFKQSFGDRAAVVIADKRPENARISVFRLGRYLGEKGPGLVILTPFIDRAAWINVGDQVRQAQAQLQMWGAIGETQTP